MAEIRALVAGNWKMNGLMESATEARALAEFLSRDAVTGCSVLLCPPFTLLVPFASLFEGTGVGLGGQNCHSNRGGAHTGDISAEMLKDLGCEYVIVGHSERRADHGETDEDVKAKAGAAQAAGMTAIVCIGETEDERDAGKTFDVVKSQLSGSLPEAASSANTVIAYEPVWAIGTGRIPSTDEVQEVHALIRAELSDSLGKDEANGIRILYGGSMKPENAHDLIGLPDVDGGLIGGASLKAEDFLAIAQSCAN